MSGHFSPRWLPEEVRYLDSILYQYPVPELVIKLQVWQKNRKTHVRSADAIRRKCYLLGRDRELQEDRLSKSQLAKMLNVSRERVTLWIVHGLPYTQRYRNREVSIAIKDFESWARENLNYLHSIESFRLQYLLPGELVSAIPQKSPFRRAVRCVDNGQTFDTIAAAAKAIGTHKVTLTRAIAANRPCKGYRWSVIDP
jgi:hypothetical protein